MKTSCNDQNKSCAIARKPRDAVHFGLMFADIHYKFKSSQTPKAKLQSSRHTCEKAEFNVKWSFKVIQGHVFWGQWKGYKGLNNVGLIS